MIGHDSVCGEKFVSNESSPLLSGSMTFPLPFSRTILGTPPNAQNITSIRLLSLREATVIIPMPVKSKYATVRGSMMWNELPPFGEQLVWPFSGNGAFATKHTVYCRIQFARLESIYS